MKVVFALRKGESEVAEDMRCEHFWLRGKSKVQWRIHNDIVIAKLYSLLLKKDNLKCGC